MTTLLNQLRTLFSVSGWCALLVTCSHTSLTAQTSISDVINSYAAVTSFDICANKITVNRTSGFQPGNTVLIIQMQGATINDSNSQNFGLITSYGGAGLYEKAVIAEISGSSITFTKKLANYELYNPAGKVQMVNIPQYGNVIVSGELTAAEWDSTAGTGGILAFEASGTVTLNADINVSGKGFRGGNITNDLNDRNSCNFLSSYTNYVYPRNGRDSLYFSFKGEGIAQIRTGREMGRGPQANGGGGGNDHNSGGGGGGNVGEGGIGGKNLDPGIFTCKGNFPGLGGTNVTIEERIFMGGGGGGGHSNERVGTAGGNGGGIIYIKANSLTGTNRVINANGNAALNGFGDGIGGGGAGGAILLDVTDVNTQNLVIEAKGGKGGNANNADDNGNVPKNRCFGPGGGGGGGLIAISAGFDPTVIKPSAEGGNPGITFNSTSNCNGSNNGATRGGDGRILTAFTFPIGEAPESGCITPTPVDYLYFKAQAQTSHVLLSWATAREQNNDYFSIERSDDGTTFYEIGQIPGKGTFNGVSTYSFTDQSPLFGIAYYRIKQVDYDTKSTYTGVESVEYSPGELVMSIFPNPVSTWQNLTINIYTPSAGEAVVRIFTLLGDEKYTKQQPLSRGSQSLELNMASYAPGIYIVHLQIGSYYKTQKIKVVR